MDGQSAAEAALTLLVVAMGGGQLTHDCGYLESGLTGSLAQMAICDEIVGWIRAATAPVDLSDEALALADIDLLGIDGSFLETDHTLDRFRERWYPALFDREQSRGLAGARRHDPRASAHPIASTRCSPRTSRSRWSRTSPRRSAPSSSGRRPPPACDRHPRRARPRWTLNGGDGGVRGPARDDEASIVDGDDDAAADAARKALEAGMDPLVAIDEGYVPGLSLRRRRVHDRRDVPARHDARGPRDEGRDGRARAGARRAVAASGEVRGRVVIGTVKGDIHEIGKNLVGTMLSASGFEVHDLGVDVPVERFVDEGPRGQRRHRRRVGAPHDDDDRPARGRPGARRGRAAPRVKVIVGGAPVTRAWAEEIGADGYSEDAVGAVALASRLVGDAADAAAGA